MLRGFPAGGGAGLHQLLGGVGATLGGVRTPFGGGGRLLGNVKERAGLLLRGRGLGPKYHPFNSLLLNIYGRSAVLCSAVLDLYVDGAPFLPPRPLLVPPATVLLPSSPSPLPDKATDKVPETGQEVSHTATATQGGQQGAALWQDVLS